MTDKRTNLKLDVRSLSPHAFSGHGHPPVVEAMVTTISADEAIAHNQSDELVQQQPSVMDRPFPLSDGRYPGEFGPQDE
jgi:hypothetical protein